MSTHVNTIHIYMLTILDFKSWVHIHITHRWVMSSVPNGVNPLIAQHRLGLLLVLKMRMLFAFIFTVRRKQDLLDWTSDRVLNWHSWFSWLVGVTMPPAHSPAYVQIVKQHWVKKLMDVTPCHLPFLSIFVLVRGAVTLYAKERLVYALFFSLRRLYMLRATRYRCWSPISQ